VSSPIRIETRARGFILSARSPSASRLSEFGTHQSSFSNTPSNTRRFFSKMNANESLVARDSERGRRGRRFNLDFLRSSPSFPSQKVHQYIQND
jgi:MarR-like DNA-binding transcriptional regulator SgrR of sgrS sRNA